MASLLLEQAKDITLLASALYPRADVSIIKEYVASDKSLATLARLCKLDFSRWRDNLKACLYIVGESTLYNKVLDTAIDSGISDLIWTPDGASTRADLQLASPDAFVKSLALLAGRKVKK
jgi:hypothetical protein